VNRRPFGVDREARLATGLRIFIVGNDGSIRPFPVARYVALVRRDESGSLPDFAGKRIQAAVVSVALENRQPLAVIGAEYDIWYIDGDGFMSEQHNHELIRAAVESLPVLVALSEDPLAKERARFRRERIKHESRWTPSPELHAYLCTLALRKR
jgi:hypothetical protein